jgi:hypothetical protein
MLSGIHLTGYARNVLRIACLFALGVAMKRGAWYQNTRSVVQYGTQEVRATTGQAENS